MDSSLPKWSQKNLFEKINYVICIILAFVIAIMASLDAIDKCDLLKIYEPISAIFLILTGILYFKYNKKLSLLLFACSFLLIFMFIFMMLIIN